MVVVATPTAFAAGLGLLAVFWAIVVGYQRRTERQAAENQHQALHDGLTGLPNRTLLRDRTGQAIRQADRELVPVALLLIDLDRFKEINDTLGHHYGDQLLIQVGERLQAVLREVDTVARLGGDEFAVLLPKIAAAEGAVVVARKLQAALEEPFTIDDLTLDVEASIVWRCTPTTATTPTSCSSAPTSPCMRPRTPTLSWCYSTRNSISTAPGGWPCSGSCAVRSRTSSWCCTTSPS
jgi:diguanylate cyclase